MQQEISRRTYFFPAVFRQFIKARIYELIGLLLLSCSILMFIALFSYNSADQSWNTMVDSQSFHNVLNAPGALVADVLQQAIGLAAYTIPMILFIWAGLYLSHRPFPRPVFRVISVGLMVTFLSAFLAGLKQVFPIVNAGCIGSLMQQSILKILTMFKLGAFIWVFNGLFLLMFFIALIYIASMSIREWKAIFFFMRGGFMTIKSWSPQLPQGLFKNIVTKTQIQREQEPSLDSPIYENREDPQLRFAFQDDGPVIEQPVIRKPNPRAQQKPQKALSLSTELGTYHLPPLDLLDEAVQKDGALTVTKQDLEENVARLSQVLTDYGISGTITRARPGPVVTLYEFMPAPGVKSSRIISLADDIARSMSAHSARIAIIPGQKEIGIELPNEKRQTVHLSELLSYEDFEKENSRLTMALGKNISGAPVYADLARMPHMIVAGTTGSGKSVGINGMILSLLYRHSPATCRLIMIDPKMLELSVYNNIPHLLTPVVTDPKKAIFALKWTVKEMENRYHAMSQLSVRNIEGYNFALAKAKAEGQKLTRRVQTGFNPETGQPIFEDQAIEMTPLPYIVVFVDEMADLMMVAGKEIESAVQRLAQMARAAGIHVIMATQRPSVDVITGTIKANFPTRISFQVASKFDSKTILGEQGAEQLLGRGDMLFMEAGGKIQRVHGPFVKDEEVERVVAFLKSQGAPNYIETITEDSGDFGLSGFGGEDDENDDVYRQAVEILKREGKASTSFIQRRLQIGYNRAARIMEQMEAEGIVSPANHVGKREILI
jgi:S-DNA-T family DNA segregation ATPase FtsK/SpoIIIE